MKSNFKNIDLTILPDDLSRDISQLLHIYDFYCITFYFLLWDNTKTSYITKKSTYIYLLPKMREFLQKRFDEITFNVSKIYTWICGKADILFFVKFRIIEPLILSHIKYLQFCLFG